MPKRHPSRLFKTVQLSSTELYRRLLGYVRPYWKAFAVAVAGMAATALLEPVFVFLMKDMLDSGFGTRAVLPPPQVWELAGHRFEVPRLGVGNPAFYPLLIVAVFLGRAVVGFVSDYAMHWVANKVVTDLRNRMFARLVSLPTRFYDEASSGALMSKISYDVQGVTAAATNVITTVVRDSIAVLGLFVTMLVLNWKLTLMTLVMVPVIAIAIRGFSRRLREMTRGAQRSMGLVNQVLQEAIEGHKVVKIFGGQPYEQERFARANQRQRGYNMRAAVAAAAQGPIVQSFAVMTLGAAMYLAIVQAAQDQTTVGGFVAFIQATFMLMPALKRITDVNAPLQKGLAAAESVFELIDTPGEGDRGTNELGHARGAIRFEHVRFRYGGASRDALEDFDLEIHPGEMVALVGQSGSGKTTLANLLPRFYPLTGGRILIDGVPVDEIRLASLRANISLVSQDVVLFNDTVAANIAYGMGGSVTEAQLVEAARAAHALEFIEHMPQGFDTMVGENGVKLSGGQRQRLAIARALLKNAPILILDEATSALDTESERAVQAALDVLMRGRTTLVIAHRLSTIEAADRIVVLERGRIAQIGRHAELIAQEGLYASLHRTQALPAAAS